MQSETLPVEDDLMPRNQNPWTQVYHHDFRNDDELALCSLKARGLWVWVLLFMWGNETDRFEGTIEELAVIIRLTNLDEIRDCVDELLRRKACDGNRDSHDNVTLVSRRLSRELRSKVSARERKRKERSRKCGHADVTRKSPSDSDSDSVHDSDSSSVSDSVPGSVSGSGPVPGDGSGKGVRNETWPHAHKPTPSPEFRAVAEVYRSEGGGIVDTQPAWEQWQVSGLEGDYERQTEICDLIRQQGQWRQIAADYDVSVPSPLRFSIFLRDERWRDQPQAWSQKLAAAIEEDSAPSWYEAEEAKYKARRALELEGGPEVASG